MQREMSYQKKFEILADWMPTILEAIKKDIKQEHLQKDKNFAKVYLPGKQVQKLTSEELAPAYCAALANEGGEELGEFIAVRWILKHSDIYHFFEKELKAINPKFEELERLDETSSNTLVNASVEQFGASKTYLFGVINSVVFPENVYASLKKTAESEVKKVHHEKAIQEKAASAEQLAKAHEIELKRISDKYEKKLIGLQNKYVTDVEALKKQVASLQRKLQGQC